MPKVNKIQSPKEFKPAETRRKRYRTRAQTTQEATNDQLPSKHSMLTRSRSRDNPSRIVFMQLTNDLPRTTKQEQRKPREKKNATKTTTKTTEKKRHLIVPNGDHQSSDGESDEPEESPPKVRGAAALPVPPRSLFSPIHHTSSPKLQNPSELLKSRQIQAPRISTNLEAPGPSNISASFTRNDEFEEIQKKKSPERENEHLVVFDNDNESSDEDSDESERSNVRIKKPVTLEVPPHSPFSPISSSSLSMSTNFLHLLHTTQLQSEESPQAPGRTMELERTSSSFVVAQEEKIQVPRNSRPSVTDKQGDQSPANPGPSNIPDFHRIDDVIKEPEEAAEALETSHDSNNAIATETESKSSDFQVETVSQLPSSSSRSFSHSRELHSNITKRSNRTPLPSAFESVILPHATDHWTQVRHGLHDVCETLEDMKKSISSYNARAGNRNFQGLSYALTEMIPPLNEKIFFGRLRTILTDLACQLPTLISQKSISILKSKRFSTLSLSRRQIASLLANSFLCTFPEDSTGSSLNFTQLFDCFEEDENNKLNKIIGKKVKCMQEYFFNIGKDEDEEEKVMFQRLQITPQNNDQWNFRSRTLRKMKVKREIEELDENILFIIFTNSIIGGGLFSFEAGPEEISFFTHPELLVLRLFAEPLEDNEILFVSGIQQFCKWEDSARSFTYESFTHKDIVIMKWERNWSPIFDIEKFTCGMHKIEAVFKSILMKLSGELKIITSGLDDGSYEMQFLLLLMLAGKYDYKPVFWTHDNGKYEHLSYYRKLFSEQRIEVEDLYNALRKYSNIGRKTCCTLAFWLRGEFIWNLR